jgi:hypothetical protein
MRPVIVAGLLVLAVSASLTPANAAGAFVCRAGTPCPLFNSAWVKTYSAKEIIEPPHNGTTTLRADGSIYYSPKPGFIGGDFMRVQVTNKFACQLPEKLQERWIPRLRCHSTWRLGMNVF